MNDPGAMRRALVYQEPADGLDAVGDAVRLWEDRFAVRAEVRDMTARERYYASQVQPEATVRVTCRWRAGIAPAGRFKAFDGAILNITGVRDPDGRRRWLSIDCMRPADPNAS